jgi:uncharacterized cupredoxin-like copper-binding protein
MAVAAAALTLVAAACGGDDANDTDDTGLSADRPATEAPGRGAAGEPRTVEVTMADNEFSPASVEVAPGETVRFQFTNDGTVTHDAVVGDAAAQAEHEDEMRAAGDGTTSMEGMGHGTVASGDEAAITVEPGRAGELTHTFAAGDALLIGCHQPGHYDAGMRIDVTVSGA